MVGHKWEAQAVRLSENLLGTRDTEPGAPTARRFCSSEERVRPQTMQTQQYGGEVWSGRGSLKATLSPNLNEEETLIEILEQT